MTPATLAAPGLVCVAGWVDALILCHSRDLLSAYMTGNTSKLGSALAEGDLARGGPIIAVIAVFLTASILAAAIGLRSARYRPATVLGISAAFLAAALACTADVPERWALSRILLLAASMGALNQALASDPGVTFITGALIRTARGAAEARWRDAGAGVFRVTVFLLGASAAAAFDPSFGDYGLAVPLAATLLGIAIALGTGRAAATPENPSP